MPSRLSTAKPSLPIRPAVSGDDAVERRRQGGASNRYGPSQEMSTSSGSRVAKDDGDVVEPARGEPSFLISTSIYAS
jgi:hypothetical protein